MHLIKIYWALVPNTETVTQITNTNQNSIENLQITYKNQSLLKFVDTMKGEEKVTYRYHIIILVLSYIIMKYSQQFETKIGLVKIKMF